MYARFRKALMWLKCYCSEWLQEFCSSAEWFLSYLYKRFSNGLEKVSWQNKAGGVVSNSPSFLLFLQKKGAKKRSPKSMYARFRKALM